MPSPPPDRPPGEGTADGSDGQGRAAVGSPGARPPWPPPPGGQPPTSPPTWAPPAGPPAGRPPWAPPPGGGGQWPPPPGREPAPPPRSRRTLALLAYVVAAALLLAAVGGVVVLLRDDGEAPTAAPTAPPEDDPVAPPTEPDPAPPADDAPSAPAGRAEVEATVAELSDYVAQVRGAPFPQPVTIELLEGDAFNDRLLADFEEAREDLELAGRVLTALRLLDEGEDLYELYRDFLGAGVLGFYDTESGELVVRGAALTPYVRSTIVHELVHAHDDQRFELYRPELDDADDESALAFSALVEGNAVRVEQAWVSELSDDEQDELFAEQLAAVAGIDIRAFPFVLLESIQFPYVAGPVFVEALLADGGEARVDEAFRSPPTTSEQIMHPERFLAGEPPLTVPPPAADGEVIDAGAFGQLSLLLTLSDVVDRETARRAAEGWGGDAYVAWPDGDRTCVRSAFAMDTPGDLRELVETWQEWADDHPDAEVVPGDGAVTVTACA